MNKYLFSKYIKSILPKYLGGNNHAKVQKMKDHSLIGKLIGFWPNEQALRDRIEAKWKTKAHYNLQLGSKVFFTIIFHHLEDKAREEDEVPYFFNDIELYPRKWVEIFYLDKEELS